MSISGINISSKYNGIGKYSYDISNVIPVFSLVIDKTQRNFDFAGRKVIVPAIIGNGYEFNIKILNHYVKKIIKENNIDIVHFTSPVRALKDPKNIVTFHDLYGLDSKNEKEKRKMYKQYIQFVDYNIISDSELLKKQLIDLGFDKNKITVIPLAVDDSVFHPIDISFDVNERDFVLTVGDGGHKNNYEVCKTLDENGIKHVHVGKNVNLTHNGNKEYIQHIDDHRLNELYNRAIATVRYSSIEGFGIPILESLFAGTPIILHRLPIFEEILGKQYPLFVDSLEEIPNAVKYAHEKREVVLNYFGVIKEKYEIEVWKNTINNYYKKLDIKDD